MQASPFRLIRNISLIVISLMILTPTLSYAQLEVGGGISLRGMKPGTGWGMSAEIGVPTESDWRLAFRASMVFFGTSRPKYRDKVDYRGNVYRNPFDSLGYKMSSFDRSVGFRIYYQVTEFQPYFGIGATYAYNDIDDAPDSQFNNLDRSLNYDFTLGASYILSDNWNLILELQMTNITRANEIIYESYVGFNFGITYRFGSNRFSNVYE